MPYDSPPNDDALCKEMMRRVLRAENDLARHKSRISDCYRYALPWRHGFDQAQFTDRLDDIFDETAMSVVEDFAADMLNTFTPHNNDWVEIEPVAVLDRADRREIEEQLANVQRVTFEEMRRSNLDMALQEAYLDLAPGTMALMISDIDPVEPFHCQAVPMTELLIDRGPFGYVDGRWRKQKRRAEDIRVLWPNARAPNETGQWVENDEVEYEVVDGVWRDWKDRGTETYQYCVQAGGKIIFKDRYAGAGSCPLIVARWGGDSTTAWGIGPLYRSTPAVKTLNHVSFLNLKNLDKTVDPVTSYEDDGVMNLDNGIDPGTWVPRAPGSEKPEVIESKGRFDVGWQTKEDLVSSIKRAHYQDRPEQRGKTPPSATQWADEAAERARRMGTPATRLVHELQYPIVKRFHYLLHKRGKLPALKLNGNEIALKPVSPLLRAQEQEQVIRYDRFAELIAGRFGPQMAAIVIDIFKHAKKVGKALGTEDVIRDEAQLKSAIEQLLPVLQASTQGAAPGAQPAPLVGPGG